MLRAGIAATLRDGGFESRPRPASARRSSTLVRSHARGVRGARAPCRTCRSVEVVRRLRAEPEPPAIVVLLGRVAPDAIAELLSLDVDGLVPRSIDGAELVTAVQRVRPGERVVDPGILVGDGDDATSHRRRQRAHRREREVLVLLAAGHSNREIASSLYVSLPTVKTHLAHIYAKLGAKNRNEALGRAVAGGLL